MPKKRPIKEPGGVLLIGLGMSAAALAEAIEALYPDAVSLTVLADEANRKIAASADEVWIYAPLGLRGFMALMRRISWRRFEVVVQPQSTPHWLKYLVWPRPRWQQDFGNKYMQ